jgi:hypothetical protein
MKLIQTNILGALGASTAFSKAIFLAECNLHEFIQEQDGSALQDIRHILLNDHWKLS